MRERLLHAVVFSVLISAQFFLRALPAVAEDVAVAAQLLAYLLARNLVFVVPFVAFVALVQLRAPPGRRRWLALGPGLAVFVGLNVAFALWATAGQFTIQLGLATHAGLALENAWTYATFGCLAIWYYESADRASRAIRSLQEQQLARRAAERWVAGLRLGVLQARLDPQLLFDTLDRAGRLYRKDTAAGDAVIADLIDYLRKALPQLRELDSTVEREVALTLAFGRLLRDPERDCGVICAFVDPEVANARFPPMVMQPLCDAMMRGAHARPGETAIRIDATRRNGDARVVASALAGLASTERLEATRCAIASRFEAQAGVARIEDHDGVLGVVLQLPYVPCSPARM